MSMDPRDETTVTDEYGEVFIKGPDGNVLVIEGDKIKAPKRVTDTSGCVSYKGDCCCFCGRLTCRGDCFR